MNKLTRHLRPFICVKGVAVAATRREVNLTNATIVGSGDVDEPTGSGHVILFADDPLFRGIFRSSARLFYNSVMLAPTN